ncbi:unnamed protein product [Toxocara canis]|uniref:Neur_chan_memb domain-containing protein n=1 Tax=Toxocara canis TaxID=6265 RepID=A0A183V4A9_TOXCA|nr:unnamed protein product [Toxocara canis]
MKHFFFFPFTTNVNSGKGIEVEVLLGGENATRDNLEFTLQTGIIDGPNEAEISLLSDPEYIRREQRKYKDSGLDSAFLGRIVKEQILDERKRIMWQWQQLATVVDRFLLVLFFLATVSTVAFFLVLPVTFRSADGQPLFL